MPDPTSVPYDVCSKHRAKLMPKLSGRILTGLCVILIFFLGFLVQSTWRASDSATSATVQLREHVAAQTVQEVGVNRSLERLEDGQKYNRQLLDEILTNGRGQ